MSEILTGRTRLVMACKAVLVATIALIMVLVAIGNLTNYDSNAAFVHHVLAMDTIFPGSHLLWRAITDPLAQTVAYDGIIAWEVLCAVVLIAGIVSRPIAVLGLTMVLVLFGVGFIAIGGEWFLMWQSSTWNGIESAFRYFVMAGITLVVVLAPNGTDD
jgi:predicted small integral membrane protein